jgi:hypothetical protein
MTAKTARYHLGKLRKHGLALEVAGGWLRAGAATLDHVAEFLKVAGVGAAQEAKHWLDRKNYKESRESWKVERRRERMAVAAKVAEMEPAEVVALADAREENL